MSGIIAVVMLVIVLLVRHWFDAFHIIFSLVTIVPFFLILYWVKKRSGNREEIFGERKPNDANLKLEEAKESAGRPIAFGILKGIVLIPLCLLIFWVVGKTPVDNLFYDRGFEQTMAEIQVLERANAHERIYQVAEERLGKKLSSNKQREMAQKEYQAMVAWGNEISNSGERKKKFEEARDFAKKWGLDSQLAEAKLESEALSEKLLAPADLASGTTGVITQIDTSIFPPSIVAYISVEDGNGEPIEWLEPKDFVVAHNDTQLTKFEVAPISEVDQSNIVLLIDTSGSTKGEPLANGQAGVQEFVSTLNSNDQVEIIAFNENPQCLAAWQSNKEILCAAVSKLKARGNTAIYDSLWQALNDLENLKGQRIIVLFTDGSDTSSTMNLETMLQKARDKKIPIYVIGLASKDLAPQILQRIADETGGCYLEAGSAAELQNLYRKIAGKIKKQYRLVLNPEIQSNKTAQSLTVTVGRKNYLKLACQYSLK